MVSPVPPTRVGVVNGHGRFAWARRRFLGFRGLLRQLTAVNRQLTPSTSSTTPKIGCLQSSVSCSHICAILGHGCNSRRKIFLVHVSAQTRPVNHAVDAGGGSGILISWIGGTHGIPHHRRYRHHSLATEVAALGPTFMANRGAPQVIQIFAALLTLMSPVSTCWISSSSPLSRMVRPRTTDRALTLSAWAASSFLNVPEGAFNCGRPFLRFANRAPAMDRCEVVRCRRCRFLEMVKFSVEPTLSRACRPARGPSCDINE